MNWIDAQKFCDGKGGYLAEIQSSEEQTNVEHMLDPRNMYWIGLTRPDDSYRSVFEWQHSKTPLAWSNWLPGHPHHYDRHDHHYADIIDNHHPGGEHKSDKGYSPIHYDRHERDCVMMGVFRDHGDKYLWDDYYCYDTYVKYQSVRESQPHSPDFMSHTHYYLHALCEAD